MVQENSVGYDGIIILGATATGKTGLSIKLAKALNTEIVNADSMYIYQDLNIGTAKPTLEEMQGITHHLISIVNPCDSFNVSEYRNQAAAVISNLRDRKLLPIVVGGTGFYIDSLIKDYNYGEVEKDINLRNQLNKELELYGKEYLYNKLKDLDMVSYNKLHINDTKRIIRAIEIALLSNKTSAPNTYIEPIFKNPLIIGLTMPRDILYERINKRVEIMIKDGLLAEVKELYDRGLAPNKHQSMKGIGYKEIYEYLTHECTLEEAVDKIKQHTRNYAKRQITWFKRNESIHWFNALEDVNIVNNILNMLNKKSKKLS